MQNKRQPFDYKNMINRFIRMKVPKYKYKFFFSLLMFKSRVFAKIQFRERQFEKGFDK